MPTARRNEHQMNNHPTARKQDQDQEEPLYDPRGLQYVEPSQTSLQCSVCCEYFTEPVSAPCGHTFCLGCITQALEVSPGCPLCRTKIDPNALYDVIALSRICDELMVYCPHKSLGCDHVCQRIQIGQHLKDDCIYIGTLCRVEECRKKLLKKDLSEHMESCPYKRVDCLMCNTKVQKSQLQEHHKTCPAESVTCPHCETTRTRLRHMEHIQECPKQIIPCTLSEFGCPWTGPRFDLTATHIPQCPYEAIRGFLEQNKQRMDSLEQENKHLRTVFHDLRPQVQLLRDQIGGLSESIQLMTGPGSFGDNMHGFMDTNQYQYHSQQGAPSRAHGEILVYDLNGAENELRGLERSSNGVDAVGDTHELLISENERIRSEIETLTAGLASLELKQNMAIMTESMRMQEEVQSLRAVCHGLRMQMHYLLLERQNPHGPPPPTGGGGVSNSGSNGPGIKTHGPGGSSGGRPLSTSGPPRPRFSDGLGRQDTKL
ncbi:hypothetical protein BGZ92_009134 [Podila epicladia]|nr:hypothetical protein BGZ92_009134 [Podila epicladia]